MEPRGLRASFTVEAAFLFPVIVLLTAFFFHTAIAQYGTVEKAAAGSEDLKNVKSVELFLDAARLNELKKEISDED